MKMAVITWLEGSSSVGVGRIFSKLNDWTSWSLTWAWRISFGLSRRPYMVAGNKNKQEYVEDYRMSLSSIPAVNIISTIQNNRISTSTSGHG